MRHRLRSFLRFPVILTEISAKSNGSTICQVGGSNYVKQQEQLGNATTEVTSLFDFCFSENGLVAWRLGKPLQSNSFIKWLGEDKYQALADFCLRYISNVKLPRKRGTFVEFRNGMINVSPVGRNASVEERNEFEAYVDLTVSRVSGFLAHGVARQTSLGTRLMIDLQI